MKLDKESMVELAELITTSLVNVLESKGVIGNAPSKPKVAEKSAYAKTEALLYNYAGFKKLVDERMAEIEDIKLHGVPQRCGNVGERVQSSRNVQGIVLPEESVEMACARIMASVQGVVDAIALIDNGMKSLRFDPYYAVLKMRYIEGRTQEDIALEFKCTQQTISNNKNRLVRELSMRLFPNQTVDEMLR